MIIRNGGYPLFIRGGSKKADIRLAGRILAKTRGPYPPDPPADIRGYLLADLIRYKHDSKAKL